MTAIKHPLHIEVLILAKEERRITSQVIATLQKISNRKLHLTWGYSSLYDYCTKALGYSEACAYRRIAAVKIVQELPEVKDKLESGEINLTNLSMAQGLISKIEKSQTADLKTSKSERARFGKLSGTDKQIILKTIEGCTKREAELRLSEIATSHGVEATIKKEKVKILGQEVQLELAIARSTFEKLERIRNLRSHKNSNFTYAELIEDMAEMVLGKIDPLRKKPAEGIPTEVIPNKILEKNRCVKEDGRPALSHRRVSTANRCASNNPRYISDQLKAKIWQRDQGRCTYVSSGRRCESNHLLQLDHVRPVMFGGEASVQNLRLLCHAHHRLREDEL